MALGDDLTIGPDDLYRREPTVLDQASEQRLVNQARLVFDHQGEHGGRIPQAARLIQRRLVLHFPGLFDHVFRQTIEPFFYRAVEEEIREDGHRRDRQEADGDEIDDEPRLDLRAQLTLAPLAPELQ